MNARRLSRMAVLTAVALIIFVVELQIPSPVPLPGVKLGLANIVTVYAMFALGPADTAMILAARLILGSVFTGRVSALLYSVSGAALCYLVMLALRKIVTERQIWVCSIISAAAHNIGQLAAAMLVTKTPALIVYLPALIISGMAAGLFTGLCAQFVVGRIKL